MLVKCICTNCAGHLEFEEENAGESIDCPHCGFETALTLPGSEGASVEDSQGTFRRLWRRTWVRGLAGLLALGAAGYSLYHWVLPPVKEALPDTGTLFLPVVVLGFGLLALLLMLTWLVFPVLLLLRLRAISRTLGRIEAGLHPFPAGEPVQYAVEAEELASEPAVADQSAR